MSHQAGYQNASKHSFKISGTEANVQTCLNELMNRMFKHAQKPSKDESEGNKDKQTTAPAAEQVEVATSKSNYGVEFRELMS